jgi:transcriptional accessory protein Tex/SPT6
VAEEEVMQVAEMEEPAVAPSRLKMDELEPGMVLTGKVKNIAKFGAFVDVGAEQDGLVHISALSDDYVKRVEDVVKVGDEVQVTVVEVDKDRQRLSLSMKGQSLQAEPEDYQEPDEQLPTAMELAMRQALEGKQRQERHKERRRKARAEQEDILARTLRLHREQKK